MESPLEITCPFCHVAVKANSYFCSNCGKPLKGKPSATTLSKQIIVYSVSLFLPPFGFWYAWKYLKQTDSKSRKIGIAAVILTIISIIVSIWFTKGFINSVNQTFNQMNNLNIY